MRLFNSYSKKIGKFKPLQGKSVKIYVCGITPYDTTHLGHAFTYVSFDALIRYLKFKGYRVFYAQNVTDIDDDILRKAKEEKRNWIELGEFWTRKFLKDLKFLNVFSPTYYVKATDSIGKIKEIIKRLISKGYAYNREGNVYFEVGKFKDYGKLSRYHKKQMIALSTERGADPSDPLKKDPLDFILWQKAKKDEPFWESPWGNGRPGWHIECSAMINQYLGDKIDIHGGGKDLIYPHHESEIAQSEIFTGEKPFVSYWMHTSMVLFEGEKMSKSLGNLVMISDLSKKYSANEIRFLLLSHHYRSPWEFDYFELDNVVEKISEIKKSLKQKLKNEKSSISYVKKLEDFIESDLDTPKTLNLIYKIAKDINSGKITSKIAQVDIRNFLKILGFEFN